MGNINNTQILKQATAYETIKLENGLTVLINEMPTHSSVHAVYATNFGSIDREFELDGKAIKLPAGIAHFLEHKMFENKEGDAFELYAKTGASANAYTSFDKTCYIFTATDNIDESLDILLKFVSEPYFTKKTVKKEQGIIGQEINMYLDSAEWRMLFALYECIFHKHYIRDDIAGSVESIAQITPELLYACTDAFYRPENMVLSVAGCITKKQVLDACNRANILPKKGIVKKINPQENSTIFQKYKEFKMEVAKPLLGIAFKETPSATPCAKTEIICDMITELIVGGMTPLYRKLYDEGLVSPGLSGEFMSVSGALVILFSAETNEPEKVKQIIFDEIERQRKNGVDEEIFTLCKNMMYGELLQDLENVDDFASGMASSFFRNRTLFEEIETLAEITVQDVNDALQNMCLEENSAHVIIRPINYEEANINE